MFIVVIIIISAHSSLFCIAYNKWCTLIVFFDKLVEQKLSSNTHHSHFYTAERIKSAGCAYKHIAGGGCGDSGSVGRQKWRDVAQNIADTSVAPHLHDDGGAAVLKDLVKGSIWNIRQYSTIFVFVSGARCSPLFSARGDAHPYYSLFVFATPPFVRPRSFTSVQLAFADFCRLLAAAAFVFVRVSITSIRSHVSGASATCCGISPCELFRLCRRGRVRRSGECGAGK